MLHLPIDRWRDWIAADCPGCGRRVGGQGLCPACLAHLRPDGARPRCPRCAHPLDEAGRCPDCGPRAPAYDRVVAAFDYAGLGRDLIHDYKIRRRLPLARLLADLLARSVEAADARLLRPHWIVPVPARREALLRRGFSPPAEVARLLARQLGLRYRLDGVRRVREGPRQAGLDRALRLRAQAGVFAVPEAGRRAPPARPAGDGLPGASADPAGPLAGQRIAVVDDVLTTGATLQAVAAALKDAGAARVEGWVLARAVVPHAVVPHADHGEASEGRAGESLGGGALREASGGQGLQAGSYNKGRRAGRCVRAGPEMHPRAALIDPVPCSTSSSSNPKSRPTPAT